MLRPNWSVEILESPLEYYWLFCMHERPEFDPANGLQFGSANCVARLSIVFDKFSNSLKTRFGWATQASNFNYAMDILAGPWSFFFAGTT